MLNREKYLSNREQHLKNYGGGLKRYVRRDMPDELKEQLCMLGPRANVEQQLKDAMKAGNVAEFLKVLKSDTLHEAMQKVLAHDLEQHLIPWGEDDVAYDYSRTYYFSEDLRQAAQAFHDQRRGLIEATVNHLATQLSEWDYEITNEAELCHLFFSAMIQRSPDFDVTVRDLKAEIRLCDGGSVDLGVRRTDSNHGFSVFLEAKVWIRPVDASAWSKRNQPTSKRKQCVADAERLTKLRKVQSCDCAALLVLERNSTHLRRLLGQELDKSDLQYDDHWIDIGRPSIGRHHEHLGIVWIR